MSHHMKLIKENGYRGHILPRRVLKGLPHVHHRQLNLVRLLAPKPLVKPIHTLFRSILPAIPNGPSPSQITHHNPIPMPLPQCNLVNPDHPRPRNRAPSELLLHVLLVQGLHRMPIQLQLFRDILHRHPPTLPPHIDPKPLRVKGIVRKPTHLLLLHFPTLPALDSPHHYLQIDPGVSTGQVPYPTHLLVVIASVNRAATPTYRFFCVRSSWITLARGSPNTPRISALGRYPGNRYTSNNRLCFPISLSCKVSYSIESAFYPYFMVS